MAIKAPNWAKSAIPTPQGWRNAKTGELLQSRAITPQQIAEFYGETVEKYVDQPVQLNEAPPNNKSTEEWNEVEVEASIEERKSLIGRVSSYLTE